MYNSSNDCLMTGRRRRLLTREREAKHTAENAKLQTQYGLLQNERAEPAATHQQQMQQQKVLVDQAKSLSDSQVQAIKTLRPSKLKMRIAPRARPRMVTAGDSTVHLYKEVASHEHVHVNLLLLADHDKPA